MSFYRGSNSSFWHSSWALVFNISLEWSHSAWSPEANSGDALVFRWSAGKVYYLLLGLNNIIISGTNYVYSTQLGEFLEPHSQASLPAHLLQPISARLEYTGKLQTADTHFRYLGQLINVHVGG